MGLGKMGSQPTRIAQPMPTKTTQPAATRIEGQLTRAPSRSASWPANECLDVEINVFVEIIDSGEAEVEFEPSEHHKRCYNHWTIILTCQCISIDLFIQPQSQIHIFISYAEGKK